MGSFVSTTEDNGQKSQKNDRMSSEEENERYCLVSLSIFNVFHLLLFFFPLTLVSMSLFLLLITFRQSSPLQIINVFHTTLNGDNNGNIVVGSENRLSSDYEENDTSCKENTFQSTFNGNNSGTVIVGEKNNLQQTSDEMNVYYYREENPSTAMRHESQYASDEEGKFLVRYAQMPQCSENKEFRGVLLKYRYRTNKLHYLRDNGRHKELNDEVTRLFDNGDATEKVIILVEMSTTLSYRKELREANKKLREALQLIPQSNLSVASMLHVLCFLEFASNHRRGGELNLALESVETALQCLENLPFSELKGYAVYERGSILALLADKTTAKEDQPLAETAEEHLKTATSMFIRLYSENKGLYMRRQSFSLCKIAITKLKCDSTDKENSSVTDACIRDASNCIHAVEKTYGHLTPPTAVIQLYIAKSDYCYCIGKYAKAMKFASQAMIIAKKLSMKLEYSRIRHRMNAINTCLQREEWPFV